MQFYVFKNDEQVGPFALMDLRGRLKSGEFAYEDLAWREGMTDWTPLKEILGGALPDATPHAVSESAPARSVPNKIPSVARLATAVVVFALVFVVLFVLAYILAAVTCGAVLGLQTGWQHPKTSADALHATLQSFIARYTLVMMAGAAIFSLVASPVIAWMMAYSNLFPWCRAR